MPNESKPPRLDVPLGREVHAGQTPASAALPVKVVIPARLPASVMPAWLKLTLVAALLAGSGIATYAYHQIRLDAEQRQSAIAIVGGNPDRAPALIVRFGCAGCHSIRGVPEAVGQSGPSLNGVAREIYVAGIAPSTVDNLLDWIVDPQRMDPQTAMPRTGISRDEARDVATYLYSLR
ncbi:MAG: hypothetical protein JWR75_1435 [Devosia sp.]|nr:hypothetical protein [Devosia sp.]